MYEDRTMQAGALAQGSDMIDPATIEALLPKWAEEADKYERTSKAYCSTCGDGKRVALIQNAGVVRMLARQLKAALEQAKASSSP